MRYMRFKRRPNGEPVVVNMMQVIFITPNVPEGSVLVYGSGENDYIIVDESVDEIGRRPEWSEA